MFRKPSVAPGSIQDLPESTDALGLDSLVREFLRDEKQPTPWYIIDSEGTGRTMWDGIVMLLILASAISIPGQLAFGELMGKDFAAALNHFHSVLLGVYGLDLVGWCFVSFQDVSGAWVVAPRRIVANYLRTWFVVDLIAMVPWPIGTTAQGMPDVPWFAMIKVLRLSRVLSNKVGSSFGITSLSGVLMRFGRMFIGVFLLVHWFACTYYAVAIMTSEEADPYLARLAELSPRERYLIELYNALSMMLGERQDGEPDGRRASVAMVAMLTGALVVATVFGNVAVLITSINISKTRLQEKMDRINESMKSCRLPLELQAVIRQYYLYLWAHHKESAGQMFVDDLSDGLRRKVRLALYRDVLVAVPIFKPLGDSELEMLALSVVAEIYMPTDLVIKEGTSANELYVIGDGQLQVSRSDGLVVAVLGRGNFFGEMALFHEDLKRNCNVAALSICDIYKINTSQIKAVLDENPELHREMLAIAESREAINANIEQKVSMFASVTCTGSLAVDFKMRLQQRILNIQRSIQRCGPGVDRESVGGWCGGGRRSTGGRCGELSTSASEHDRANRLSRSLSVSGGGGLLSSKDLLKGAAGEARPPLGKAASRKEASRRASSTTKCTRFTFTRSGGKRGSLNEIQVGSEVSASAGGEGTDVEQGAVAGEPTRARVPPPGESAAQGREGNKGWRSQFDLVGASSKILNIDEGGKANNTPGESQAVLDAQAPSPPLSCSEAVASELAEVEGGEAVASELAEVEGGN